jgi:hypothetical protein
MTAQNLPQSDDRVEKLITVLGQRINGLNKTLQTIAEGLQRLSRKMCLHP